MASEGFKHIGLFEGIGGFSLAAHWMGWETIAWCEWNEFGQRVLRYHFPEAEGYGDITKTDFKKYANTIDIVTGGFPCQPYSNAGKRKGKEDERHLWPEMLRSIREIQPPWVVGENVLGLVNWNGGLVFHEVQADLEAEGYEVLPFILPACSKNAPHRRDRVWFIAYSNGAKQKYYERAKGGTAKKIRRETESDVLGKLCSNGITSDTNNERLQGCEKFGSVGESRENGNKFLTGLLPSNFREFPTQPPVRNGNDGLPTELDRITVSNWINESIKAGGNAIVPQVALEIFKTIQSFENLKNF